MSSAVENKADHALLANSRAKKSNFRMVKNEKGEKCLEYSINFEIPGFLEDNYKQYLKCYMIKKLYRTDYLLNKSKIPVEFKRTQYNEIFWGYATIATVISWVYFFKYLKHTKKFGFIKRYIGISIYMSSTGYLEKYLESKFKYKLNSQFNKNVLGLHDINHLHQFNDFEKVMDNYFAGEYKDK